MTSIRLLPMAVFFALATTPGFHPALAQAPDGLPVFIPPPSSPPPTTAEWNAVTWEVTVKFASNYHCQTKMVREWLRVLCTAKANWQPKNVKTIFSHGYQASTSAINGTQALLVVQVVKGRMYVARFTWGPNNSSRDLTVNWPSNATRPMLSFN